MNVECQHCHALHWDAEKLKASTLNNKRFGQCCLQGQVDLPPFPRGSYTEPWILMDSIRSPSGVHQESTWTSLKWSNCVLLKNPAGLHVYSRYTPLGVLMESTRSDTIPGLLKKSFNTEAGFCPDSTNNPFNIPN